ncbi:acid protease [Clavulina sp. PMI_390]|nr:acid protease [Clavulina sp. PMI_390]
MHSNTLLLLALSAAIPSFAAVGGKISTIPLAKRQSTTSAVADVDQLRQELASLKKKYDLTLAYYEQNTGIPHPNGLVRSLTKTKKRVSTANIPLIDDQNNLWYGIVTVGTPPISYTVDFDTGSSDFFVPASSCSSCGNHTLYNPAKSSTAKALSKTFSLAYGDGSTTSGKLYTDRVAIGNLIAKNQTIGSATSYSSSFETSTPDGLMGLAWPALSSFGATPFFNTLVNTKAVTPGQFGFYLAATGSELHLGGADTSKYAGAINWRKVTQEGYWQIDMDSMDVDGKAVVSKLSAIVDSGTTLIVGDTDKVAKFWAGVPGSKDASKTFGSGFYSYPCNSTATVSAVFGGKKYDIAAQWLSLGLLADGSTECVGSIVTDGLDDEFWILGDVFMRNVYTIFSFDSAQVGFATLK